jgi:DNA-binding GntR family transcriptional regulator
VTGDELPKDLLSDRVYAMIRSSILSGERGPGDRLIESEIARRLGISQAPVREAVQRLAHEGLVVTEPRRGSYVTSISPQEFEIARELRAALERIGARTATAAVVQRDLDHLRSITTTMRHAVAISDSAAFRRLDMEFHAYVVGIGKRAILDRVWSTLEPLLVSQRAIGDPSYDGDREQIVRWHENLIDSLESGDAEAAGEAFFIHATGQTGSAVLAQEIVNAG